MLGLIVLIVSLISAAVGGYICGKRSSAGRNTSTNRSDASVSTDIARIEQQLADNKRATDNAVEEAGVAGKTIQEIVSDIRNRSDSNQRSDNHEGGK